jgi:hypothetical protein
MTKTTAWILVFPEGDYAAFDGSGLGSVGLDITRATIFKYDFEVENYKNKYSFFNLSIKQVKISVED